MDMAMSILLSALMGVWIATGMVICWFLGGVSVWVRYIATSLMTIAARTKGPYG